MNGVAQDDINLAFLRSHLTLSGQCPSLEEASAWYWGQQADSGFSVRRVPLGELREWEFVGEPLKMAHRSGRFFSLAGLRAQTSFGPVKSWDQPIIDQPEIGILGFLTRKFEGVLHFLVQAKREPGNINILQLAPTVQATWSNYTRVHKGKNTPYLEYFANHARSRTLLDQLQTEQGSRFLGKRNRNMIVETTDDVEVRSGFRWLTLGQIKALLGVDNVVNMDTRSVLSLIPLVNLDAPLRLKKLEAWNQLSAQARALCLSTANTGREQASMDEILAWINELKTNHVMKTTVIPLDRMRGWVMSHECLQREDGLHFSVIGLDVSSCCRETASWSQPIQHHARRGLRGFLLRDFDGVPHLLARASLEPGSLDGVEIGPTVSCSDASARREGPLAPPLMDLFLDPDPKDVLYHGVQSEEGGRFYHFENEYLIRRAPPGLTSPGPLYRWMTLGQLLRFARHGALNMEVRNLLACLGVSLTDAAAPVREQAATPVLRGAPA